MALLLHRAAITRMIVHSVEMQTHAELKRCECVYALNILHTPLYLFRFIL